MLTIGEVLDAIKGVDDELTVLFAFGGVHPTTIDSWRGVYSEAAIGFSPGDYGDPRRTVGEFRKELNNALNSSFDGWKGGEYTYERDTPLHVDNRGCYTNTELTRVEVTGYNVILHTERNTD